MKILSLILFTIFLSAFILLYVYIKALSSSTWQLVLLGGLEVIIPLVLVIVLILFMIGANELKNKIKSKFFKK